MSKSSLPCLKMSRITTKRPHIVDIFHDVMVTIRRLTSHNSVCIYVICILQSIGKCYRLRVLDVAANELRIFPTEVSFI